MSEEVREMVDSEKQGVNMVKKDARKIPGSIVDESELRGRIYVIRGQKVMLDADLAEIYGYTTSAFNQQVTRNIEKFDEDFMFRLDKHALDTLLAPNEDGSISQNVISMQTEGVKGGRAKMPYAFTEQGIYMLMTVLRGELATRQSKALIRTFKRMKDCIMENQQKIEYRSNLQLAMQVAENTRSIDKMRSEMGRLDEEMAEVHRELNDTVKKSDISPILLDFNNVAEQSEYVFLDGELMRANELYIDIYSGAKESICIIDDYISIKTLRHLQNVKTGIKIVVLSDNKGKYLCKSDYEDFRRERDDLEIKFVRTEGRVHDRFAIVDYGLPGETIYHCGASEKDAGRRLMMVSKYGGGVVREAIHEVIEKLLEGGELELR